MAVGVIADEMPFVVHSFDEFGMEFCMFTRDKEGRLYLPLFQLIEKLCGIDRVRTVIEREGGTFDIDGGLGGGGDCRDRVLIVERSCDRRHRQKHTYKI